MEKIMIAVASSSLSRQRRGGIGFRSENPAPKKHHLIQSAPYCLRAYVEFLIQFYVLNLTGREPRAENSTCSRKVYCLLHTNDTSTVVLRSVLQVVQYRQQVLRYVRRALMYNRYQGERATSVHGTAMKQCQCRISKKGQANNEPVPQLG